MFRDKNTGINVVGECVCLVTELGVFGEWNWMENGTLGA